ncbi:MAG: ribosome-binding factor A [Patescibacteria group bacterium]
MTDLKLAKMRSIIMELAGSFIEAESNRTSLITVTDCRVSEKMREATVFFTVFPEEKEKVVMEFLQRKGRDFQKYIRGNARMRNAPFVTFELDMGEKHRQKIDELLRRS